MTIIHLSFLMKKVQTFYVWKRGTGKLDTLKSFEILLKRSNNEWSWSTDSDTLSFDETKLKGKTIISFN